MRKKLLIHVTTLITIIILFTNILFTNATPPHQKYAYATHENEFHEHYEWNWFYEYFEVTYSYYTWDNSNDHPVMFYAEDAGDGWYYSGYINKVASELNYENQFLYIDSYNYEMVDKWTGYYEGWVYLSGGK